MALWITTREDTELDIQYMLSTYIEKCDDAQLKALQTHLAKKHHELADPVPRRQKKAPQEQAPPKPA